MRLNKMEHENVAETRPPKGISRFLRFRLRTLLLVFTIFGVFIGPELYTQIRQHNAAKRLSAIPNTYLAYDYDFESDDKNWAAKFPPIRSKVAKAFHWVTGSHFFNPVVRLVLSDTSVESISLVGELRNLKWLHIENFSTGSLTERKITSLKSLQNCTRLEYLVVGNWLNLRPNGSVGFRGTGTTLLPYDITDSDVAIISELKYLRVLAIGGEHIDDESIKMLANLDSLEQLYLSRTNMTETGLDEFRQSNPNVQIVELNDLTADYSAEISDQF